MKALVSYISIHHGNTAKIAQLIAVTIGADLLPLQEVEVSMLERYDLVGFGSGVYFGRHHGTLLRFVDELPVLTNKKAFIFATSGLRRVRFVHDFSRPLKKRLWSRGLDVVGEFSCRGLDTFGATMIVGGINRGRPDAGDLRAAEDFARTLLDG
ncbi:MAG: flavodoxin family protein [Dehalococcoidia bacterium]